MQHDSEPLSNTKLRYHENVVPLTEEEKSVIIHAPQMLQSPTYDMSWMPNNLTDLSHVLCNERGIDFFKSVLSSRDTDGTPFGLFVGLGAEQNYSMIAYANPRFALLFDYDPSVVATHHIHRAAFLTCRTIEDFIDFYENDSLEHSLEILAQYYGENLVLFQQIKMIFKNYLTGSSFRFKMMQAEFEGQSGRYKDTFVNDAQSYETIKRMYEEDRIIISMGNLFDPQFIDGIGRLAEALGEVITGFFTSNAPEYDPEAFAEIFRKIIGLSTDENSVLLLTSKSYSEVRTIGCPYTSLGYDVWDYIALNFKEQANIYLS